jgi:hypothetical protein
MIRYTIKNTVPITPTKSSDGKENSILEEWKEAIMIKASDMDKWLAGHEVTIIDRGGLIKERKRNYHLTVYGFNKLDALINEMLASGDASEPEDYSDLANNTFPPFD